jgi:hypothetical protein
MTRQLPLSIGALVAIAVTCVIAVGGYVGVVAPRRREVARLESQLNAVQKIASAAAVAPITESERTRWREIDALVRGRFVSSEDQLRLVLEIGQAARATGLRVTDLRLEDAGGGVGTSAGAVQAVTLPSAVPPNFAVNSGVVSLSAHHNYGDLIAFLDRVVRGNTYVALQALDVRRVGDHLESDIRLASLRWTK